jgi:hypothetical protein
MSMVFVVSVEARRAKNESKPSVAARIQDLRELYGPMKSTRAIVLKAEKDGVVTFDEATALLTNALL